MKREEKNPGKELYQQLRRLSRSQLWDVEVPRFDRATPQERTERVALVRAVGVVFSEVGTPEEKCKVRHWLVGLLNDPGEKVRRYAITALPKMGAGSDEEQALLALLQTTGNDREKKFLGETLDKIGGTATLELMMGAQPTTGGRGLSPNEPIEPIKGLSPQTEQKVRASVARSQSPSRFRLEPQLAGFAGLRIHLRGRLGLESWVREEVMASSKTRGKFKVVEVRGGLVVLEPVAPFSLGDLYSLRCFGTVGFVPGFVSPAQEAQWLDSIASVMTSPLARRVFKTFTEGTVRYRLDFAGKGHQRGAVRLLANRAYALCPEILNDARTAPWSVDIQPEGSGHSVELRPRLIPDPRYYFRKQDVPAASHPPLAACLARWAGSFKNEVVWDPFCGSGTELIERALLGGVQTVHGTDLSSEAIAIARENFEAAKLPGVAGQFSVCDFRDYPRIGRLGPGSVSLILTNPPLGKRVPIPNLHGLIHDLFGVAARVLKPGGRLILANPLPEKSEHPQLQLQSERVVDFGGFNCRLELYLKK